MRVSAVGTQRCHGCTMQNSYLPAPVLLFVWPGILTGDPHSCLSTTRRFSMIMLQSGVPPLAFRSLALPRSTHSRPDVALNSCPLICWEREAHWKYLSGSHHVLPMQWQAARMHPTLCSLYFWTVFCRFICMTSCSQASQARKINGFTNCKLCQVVPT